MTKLRFQISADEKLSFHNKVAWFTINFIRNLFSFSVDGKLIVKKFQSKLPISAVTEISKDRSPGRRVCDLFWESLPIETIINTLGSINVLEVGCGKGTYGLFINRVFDNRIDKYTGVDITVSDDWNKFNKEKFDFFAGDASDISGFLKNKNLIITQSALEHFPDDFKYFKQVKDYVNKTNKPIIQIHMVPSPAGLWLYLLHGFRQYTIQRLSRITKLFSDINTCKIIYSLGGRYCNKVHFKYFTSSLLGRQKDRTSYNSEFVEAFRKDMNSNNTYNASFYCLVLLHNIDSTIKDEFLKA